MQKPTSGTSFTAGSNVVIETTAFGDEGVQKVDFYAGTQLLGTAFSAPYNFTWSAAPTGSHTLTAKVTDTFGNTATSSPVSITVVGSQPPFITMQKPTSGTSFQAGSNVVIETTAFGDEGVAKVDFYAGTQLLGTATSAPY